MVAPNDTPRGVALWDTLTRRQQAEIRAAYAAAWAHTRECTGSLEELGTRVEQLAVEGVGGTFDAQAVQLMALAVRAVTQELFLRAVGCPATLGADDPG